MNHPNLLTYSLALICGGCAQLGGIEEASEWGSLSEQQSASTQAENTEDEPTASRSGSPPTETNSFLGENTADPVGPHCPEGMVHILTDASSFCIDSAEVTNRAYRDYLLDWSPNLPSSDGDEELGDDDNNDDDDDDDDDRVDCEENQPMSPNSGCSWNAWTEGLEERPVVCVDWCDAADFCQSRGKRLCGRTEVSSTELNGEEDDEVAPSQLSAEWSQACEGDDQDPYSSVSGEAHHCNGRGYSRVDVRARSKAEMASCEGGTEDLYNMSGNVFEWTDECDGKKCTIRGGSFSQWDDKNSCSEREELKFDQQREDVGFRCCMDG